MIVSREDRILPLASLLTLGFLALHPGSECAADGIYRNGISARAMALGGIDVPLADTPLDALHLNPAGLALLSAPTLQIGAAGALARGEFRNAANTDGEIRESLAALPEIGFGFRTKSSPLAFGLAVFPEAGLQGDWRYMDAPGGLDGVTTYGLQRHRSEIAVVRTALGVAAALNDSLSLGASAGLIYNRNTLQAPYIFQSHPVLQGFKTLLDLQTEGFGFNATLGLLYRPNENWSLGLAYQSETRLDSDGDASGNAAAQLQSLGGAFAGVRPDFHYDATVANVFPQTVSAGASWQISPRVRSLFQVDWINWSDAFDDLNITLTQGNNADLNAFLGTDSIRDTVPLRWQDRFVYRLGLELEATDNIVLRAGYSYGESPVPTSTLSPLTAAIMEHTLTAGAGWNKGRYAIDLAYQYDLPSSRSTGVSALKSGEYSASQTEVAVHWIGLTTSVRF